MLARLTNRRRRACRLLEQTELLTRPQRVGSKKKNKNGSIIYLISLQFMGTMSTIWRKKIARLTNGRIRAHTHESGQWCWPWWVSFAEALLVVFKTTTRCIGRLSGNESAYTILVWRGPNDGRHISFSLPALTHITQFEFFICCCCLLSVCRTTAWSSVRVCVCGSPLCVYRIGIE